MVLPENEALAKIVCWEFVKRLNMIPRLSGPLKLEAVKSFASQFDPQLEIQIGNLAGALAAADVAITKSGTVTLECAAAAAGGGVLQTSWPTYFIGKRIITVKYLAMPNLLADEELTRNLSRAKRRRRTSRRRRWS